MNKYLFLIAAFLITLLPSTGRTQQEGHFTSQKDHSSPLDSNLPFQAQTICAKVNSKTVITNLTGLVGFGFSGGFVGPHQKIQGANLSPIVAQSLEETLKKHPEYFEYLEDYKGCFYNSARIEAWAKGVKKASSVDYYSKTIRPFAQDRELIDYDRSSDTEFCEYVAFTVTRKKLVAELKIDKKIHRDCLLSEFDGRMQGVHECKKEQDAATECRSYYSADYQIPVCFETAYSDTIEDCDKTLAEIKYVRNHERSATEIHPEPLKISSPNCTESSCRAGNITDSSKAN